MSDITNRSRIYNIGIMLSVLGLVYDNIHNHEDFIIGWLFGLSIVMVGEHLSREYHLFRLRRKASQARAYLSKEYMELKSTPNE